MRVPTIPIRILKQYAGPVACVFDPPVDTRNGVAIERAHSPVLGEDYMPFTHSVERWIA